jgi:hypothetical protein
MRTTTGGQIEGGQVKIDNNVYINVVFVDVRLVYAAEGPVVFSGCVFQNCAWGFLGAASSMAMFLQYMFTPESGAREIAESIVTTLRNQELTPFDVEA